MTADADPLDPADRALLGRLVAAWEADHPGEDVLLQHHHSAYQTLFWLVRWGGLGTAKDGSNRVRTHTVGE